MAGGARGLAAGLVTSIGSLPHRDPDVAADFVLRHSRALPAAPQLPRRTPLEGMVAQAARGIEGVTVRPDGSLLVVPGLDAGAAIHPTFDGASHAGLLAFLAAAAGRAGPVKLQVTGPVTLGSALVDAGADPGIAYPLAASAVRAEGGALLELCRRRLPESPLVVFVDEPILVRPLPLAFEQVVDLVSSALAPFEHDAVTGVHCCGHTDWRIASSAGATVLSMPVDAVDTLANATVLSGHLDRGGWIAWGAVPTSGPVGTDAERLWRRLSSLWNQLEDLGCDPVQLREQALVTPACGLSGHGLSQASRSLRLAAAVGARVAAAAASLRNSASS
jgi:methionine synthase II (cobalamin-independent)